MSEPNDPGAIAKRLEQVEGRLKEVHDRAIGDRNNQEAFKKTLPGEIEAIQKEVSDIKTTVEGWKGTLNKGVTGFILALLGALAGFVVTRLTAGG